MLKKTLIAGAVGLTTLAIVGGRDAWSYLTTSVGWVNQSVRSSVPAEFELERAKREIAKLEPEVERSMHLIAKEEIALERLAEKVADLEQRQDQERDNLDRLTNDLQTGSTQFVYAGRSYARAEVKTDLANRFQRFKTNGETLASLRKMLNSREQLLVDTRQKVEEMLAMKQQLLADVANLEARQKMVDIAKNSSELVFDDSQLARTNKLIDEIRTRIEVDERLLSAEHDMLAAIPVDEVDDENIVAEVTAYLNGDDVQPELASFATTTP